MNDNWLISSIFVAISTVMICRVFLKNGPTLAFFCLFLVFSNKHYKFLQQIYVKKCPSSIWWRDLNPRSLERESPPITTRPGLPPNMSSFIYRSCRFFYVFKVNIRWYISMVKSLPGHISSILVPWVRFPVKTEGSLCLKWGIKLNIPSLRSMII